MMHRRKALEGALEGALEECIGGMHRRNVSEECIGRMHWRVH